MNDKVFSKLDRRTFMAATTACFCPTLSKASSHDISEMIVFLTDRVRRQDGRGHLTISPRLSHAAETFSQVLATRQDFSHTADGRTLSDRAISTGYEFQSLGENIGWTSRLTRSEDIADDLVKRWMASRGHRANILNRRFKDIGIGVTQSGGRTYAVQIFGKKLRT